MGLTYADVTLVNSIDAGMARRGAIANTDIRQMKVSALVDSGAYLLTIDESLHAQLGLDVLETREIELADGSRSEYEIVGPVDLFFENRRTTCCALVLPGATEVLLVAIPLEDLDVMIEPKSQQLIVNPARPYLAGTKVKWISIWLTSIFE